jgi:hypothetical protein
MRIALLALAALLTAASAQAQDRIALAVEGWTATSKPDGIVAYRCASSICASGSEVSYKRQPHRPQLTLDDFRTHHERIAAQSGGVGRLRELRISAPQQRILDGVRVLQLRRDFFWADGTTSALIESRLIGPHASYSLVSVSPRYDWTRNNFEGFLARMVDIASLATGQSADAQ